MCVCSSLAIDFEKPCLKVFLSISLGELEATVLPHHQLTDHTRVIFFSDL